MALTQVSSEGIKDAQVKTADILDANITTAKVADNAITGAKVADNLDIPDNNKIRFGTGNDLEIYHDGSDSRIHNTGTGNIIIKGDDVHIQGDNGENMANFNEDAGVQIRYDGTTKFETTSTGVKINNRFEMVNGSIADNLAGGNNFGLSFNGDGLRPTDGSHTESNNSHDLGNSSKRWRNLWIGNDIDVLDNGKILLGDSDDLQIYHDGSDSYIDDAGTGDLCIRGSTIYLQKYTGENCAKFVADGAVELYHNNSKKFETNANGCLLRDDVKLTFGDDTDFQLYHLNGGYAYLRDFSGIFYLQTNNFTVTNNAGDETILQGLNNGTVSLYYDNSKKLDTQSYGMQLHDATAPEIRFLRTGNSGYAKIYADSANRLYLSSDHTSAGADSKVAIVVDGTERAYWDSEYYVKNGSIVFQTADKGVCLGSTTLNAANTLKDYEEGTWTPKLYANGVDTGVTYQANHGVYTKIGNLVHLRGVLNLTDKGNGSSGHAIAIGNFPFTVANMVNSTSNDGTGWLTYWYDFQDQFSWLSFWVQESTTYAYLKGVSGTSTDSNSSVNVGNIKDSSEFRFAFTYHVA
jgi:hypothetical protein